MSKGVHEGFVLVTKQGKTFLQKRRLGKKQNTKSDYIEEVSDLLQEPSQRKIDRLGKYRDVDPQVDLTVQLVTQDPNIKELLSLDKQQYYELTSHMRGEDIGTLDQLRFMYKYKIKLTGYENHRKQLAYMEVLLDKLPSQYHRNNPYLDELNFEDVTQDNTLAYYQGNCITFTDAGLGTYKHSFDFDSLDDRFAFAFYHEIGHSVLRKATEEHGWAAAKEFSDQVGWNLSESQLQDISNINFLSTEQAPALPKADKLLVTAYAETNPFEAFAEYFAYKQIGKTYDQPVLRKVGAAVLSRGIMEKINNWYQKYT